MAPKPKRLWDVFAEEEKLAASNTSTCPHCGSSGSPTNKYLLRCDNVSECGRYFA